MALSQRAQYSTHVGRHGALCTQCRREGVGANDELACRKICRHAPYSDVRRQCSKRPAATPPWPVLLAPTRVHRLSNAMVQLSALAVLQHHVHVRVVLVNVLQSLHVRTGCADQLPYT